MESEKSKDDIIYNNLYINGQKVYKNSNPNFSNPNLRKFLLILTDQPI